MRILFLARHFTYFRNFDSVIRRLAERGHELHLAAEREESLGGQGLVQEIAERYPAVTFGHAPDRSHSGWAALATKIRLSFDYLRYLEPAYESAPKLRERARERVPRLVVRLAALPGLRSTAGRRALAAGLRTFENAMPRDPAIDAFLVERRPDIVLITPLIGVIASPQPDYLRSAVALGLPTALCVWSWDHLSSKALIRQLPDRVFVWNEAQKREAIHMHGVPAECVVITGAQCFDQWFGRSPSRGYADFCRHVGLPGNGPYVLYVCSALFAGSPPESAFVAEWLRQVRSSSDARLRDVAVLVRPHPSRMSEWAGADLSALGPVAIWGGNPIDAAARADYFDSLYHSSAVVGLNTSAFLEAAIVGRPVHTVLLPEFYDNQEGTIHFHYLLTVAGGLLCATRSFEDHLTELSHSLTAGPEADHRRFAEAFIRPHGLEVAAETVFVQEVERVLQGARPRAAEAADTPDPLRLVLRPIAALVAAGIGQGLVMDEREAQSARRVEQAGLAKQQRKSESLRIKQQQRREKKLKRTALARGKRRKLARWRRQKITKLIKKKIGIA